MAGNGHHSVVGDQDRISDLPDDLLLQILVLLPLVEAVRTCVLSHRWRHVWRRLPLLEFADDEDAPGASSFANLVAGVIHGYANDVRMPDVFISVRCPNQYDFYEAVRIAASAFLVAQRANTTTRFGFFMSRYAVNLDWDETDEEDDEPMLAPAPLHMPCFPMVTEFALSFTGVDLRMPRNGTFEKLTKLYIYGVRFTDGGEGINSVVTRQCPCLKDLELHTIVGLKTFFLVSESILRLCLLRVTDLERLLVTAKSLREMEVAKCFVHAIARTWIWLNLPRLEQLHWEDCCPEVHRWSLPRRLQKLTVIELSRAYLMLCDGGQSHFTRILQAFEHIGILRLQIPIEPLSVEQKNLIENTSIPLFGELDLNVHKNEHMSGPTILKLLNRHYWVRKLSIKIIHDAETENIIPPCAPDCGCRRIQDWRGNKMTLPCLKWLVIKKYRGTKDETSLLYFILRNAKALQKVSIVFFRDARPPQMFLYLLNKLAPSGCIIDCSRTI